mmetsp:Transcript_43208/g.107953  ORF Transcript_43208/g.107953 Transcript_43208/m.107953 type:complete len:119 (+) Transcript_43208:316-672(+)
MYVSISPVSPGKTRDTSGGRRCSSSLSLSLFLCWNLSFSSISTIRKQQAAGNAFVEMPECVYTTSEGDVFVFCCTDAQPRGKASCVPACLCGACVGSSGPRKSAIRGYLANPPPTARP